MIPLDAIDKLEKLALKAINAAIEPSTAEDVADGFRYRSVASPKTILALCRALKEAIDLIEPDNEEGYEWESQKTYEKIKQILSEI